MKNSIKLSEFAKRQSITYRTAQNWYYNGKIPNSYKVNNHIYIEINEIEEFINPKIVVYARVSSNDQKDDLNRQIERLKSYCAAKGYIISKVYSEIASGLNDNRKQFNAMLNDKDVNKIVVVSKDRLTRFGFNFIKLLTKRLNIEIEIIDQTEKEENLIEDFVSIITSFCAKIYGKRSGKNKIKEITNIL